MDSVKLIDSDWVLCPGLASRRAELSAAGPTHKVSTFCSTSGVNTLEALTQKGAALEEEEDSVPVFSSPAVFPSSGICCIVYAHILL